MKNVSFLRLVLGFMLLLSGYQLFGQYAPAAYFKVDSNIQVKFMGNPTRYFYQTPLGDITIYEYKPESSFNDSNCLYSVALYKAPAEEVKEGNLSKLQTDVRYNAIISADEMAINNLGGKILSKDEVNFKDIQGIRMKIIFANLSDVNEIEGHRNVIYIAEYLKYNGIIIKLWTYTPVNMENKRIGQFFNSLKFGK